MVQTSAMRSGTCLVGLLNPYDSAAVDSYAKQGLSAFAMEWLPRTTRAQAMDVLSSQANIAGYKAVVIAANEYQRFFPMLMTAAGTVKAARVLILGAGVAGLQAIATAKRLGAVIEASDVRPAVKEQIEYERQELHRRERVRREMGVFSWIEESAEDRLEDRLDQQLRIVVEPPSAEGGDVHGDCDRHERQDCHKRPAAHRAS